MTRKCGEFEYPKPLTLVPPDPTCLEIAQKLIEQNGQILRMNIDLLKVLSLPMYYIKREQ